MKKLYLYPLLMLLISLMACQQQQADTPTDYGLVKEGIYQYPALGISIPIPSNWEQPSAAIYKKIRATNSPSTKILLIISKDDIAGEQTDFNSNVVVMVEKITQESKVKTERDYLYLTKKTLEENQQLYLTFEKDIIQPLIVGEETMQMMQVNYMKSQERKERSFSQQFYSKTLKDNHILTLLVSYDNEQGREYIAKNILQKITFSTERTQ